MIYQRYGKVKGTKEPLTKNYLPDAEIENFRIRIDF